MAYSGGNIRCVKKIYYWLSSFAYNDHVAMGLCSVMSVAKPGYNVDLGCFDAEWDDTTFHSPYYNWDNPPPSPLKLDDYYSHFTLLS